MENYRAANAKLWSVWPFISFHSIQFEFRVGERWFDGLMV